MKNVLALSAAFSVLTGCYNEGRVNTSFSQVETPNGIETVKVTSSPGGSDVVRKSTSSPQFRDCLRNVSPTMGTAEADAYCRNWTSGAVGSSPMGGPGTLAVQLNTGSYNQVTPWNGSPTYGVDFQPQANDKMMGAIVRQLDRNTTDICARNPRGVSCK